MGENLACFGGARMGWWSGIESIEEENRKYIYIK